MTTPVGGSILLSVGRLGMVEDVRTLLQDAGHEVACHAPDDGLPPDPAQFRTIIVESSRDPHVDFAHCRQLRLRLQDCLVPILYIAEGAAPLTRFDALEAGADAILHRPFAPRDLVAQVQALLRIKDAHDRLVERTSEINRVNRKLHQVNQQMNQELVLARRIQLSFLPQQMPELPGARFAVHYDLCGHVGGDFYDVFRLDENHIGFYVADAMGHGVPAALLTIFVKKGVRTKEIHAQQYRLVPPSEVLELLNHDLIEQQLAETPFITMVYALLNFRTGLLTFSRAGHPHPIRIARNGVVEPLQVTGSLMGIFATSFPLATLQLQPGDKVLFFSDGVDSASSSAVDGPGPDGLARCARRLHGLPIDELVERLPIEMFGEAGPGDDFTLLGLEFDGAGQPPSDRQ